MTAPATRREGALTEWLLRGFAVLIYGFALWRLGYAWQLDPSRWTIPLLLLTEAYTLLMILLARPASARDMAPLSIVATGYAAFFFVLLDARNTMHLVPEAVGVGLQLAGLAGQFSAKIVLGRSFGLLPAQRGLVMAGPYRVVRHPIYLGYLVSHIGFLLANASWQNLAVLAALYAAQVWRIRREEQLLAAQEAYRAYQARVHWRLLPFIY